MSRDNKVEINAGGSVTVDALAVGDHARAASIRSAQAEELTAQFVEIRTILEQLQASGSLQPAEAKLLADESADVETSAQAALTDQAAKETLVVKLKRFAGSVKTFCKDQESSGVFTALQTIASVCAIPLALLGIPTIV